MKTITWLAGSILALIALFEPGLAQAPKSGIERMYVLYCGDIVLTDMGRFSPGYSGPGALSSTCYLFKYAQGWLLWDTGLPDAIASMPDGQKSNAGVWYVKTTLASQLDEIGVKPSDIRYLALSHSHGDHVGNVNLFPTATLVVQKAEYDWPDPLGVPRFNPNMKVIKAEGDHDLFGDGSVLLISTPGHSPGHQCLPASQAAQDRRADVLRRCGPHQGQLGQQAHAEPELQPRPVAGHARSHGRRPQGAQCSAVDRA